MKLETHIARAYRRWCQATFPNYKVADFPLRGRMYEVWVAAWVEGMNHAYAQGDRK